MTTRMIVTGVDPVVLCHGLGAIHDRALRAALTTPDFAPYEPHVCATDKPCTDWSCELLAMARAPDNVVLVGVECGCEGVLRTLVGFESRPRPIRSVVLVDCAVTSKALRFWVDRARANKMRFAVVYDGHHPTTTSAARRITGMRMPDDCVPMGACDEGGLIAEAWDGPVDVPRAIAEHAMRCARSKL
jgi:hypothetical protein